MPGICNARLVVASKYVLYSRTRVELGEDVSSYKVLASCGSALACEEMIILLGKQFLYTFLDGS